MCIFISQSDFLHFESSVSLDVLLSGCQENAGKEKNFFKNIFLKSLSFPFLKLSRCNNFAYLRFFFIFFYFFLIF
jgi:hypothetical protein